MRTAWLMALVLGMVGMAMAQEKAPAWKPVGTDIIPADRQADWRPGITVGVPGGIPERKDPAKIINVKEAPYLASGSDKSTTGSIEAGSDVLTVTAPIDFKVGQAMRIPGECEIAELTITAGADADGKVKFSIDSPMWGGKTPPNSVDVKAGDSPEAIAKKIGSIYLNGFGVVAKGSTVTFRAVTNMAYEITFDGGDSSVKGTVKTVADGCGDLVAKITAMEGNKMTLAGKAPVKRGNKTVFHDDTAAIQSAIGAAKDEEVVYVPAGTYLIGGLGLGGKHMTLRGAGQDKTVIVGSIHMGGGGADWWYGDRMKFMVSGNPKRGDTVLTVGDTKALDAAPNGGIGEPVQLAVKNDDSIPIMPARVYYQRAQVSRIVAKTATTVTISPGLLFDLPAELAPQMRPGGRWVEFTGIEDLKIDGTNSNMSIGIGINVAYGCWVKNVTILNITNYHISLADSMQCEIRGSVISKRKGAGSNGAGILFGTSSFCLIEDNIMTEQFPHVEVNRTSGSVFAYNACYDSAVFIGKDGMLGCSIDTNHGAHSNFNLYEGNVAQRYQSDGYHGGSSHDTAFRNWFNATSDKTNEFWIAVNLNRWTRNYSLVGNILGQKGYTWEYQVMPTGFGYDKHYIYSLGYPNMGNGWANGETAQLSKGKPWKDWPNGPNSGYQELDLDVAATTILLGNYNYADKKVPESEDLKGKKLPASLYLEKKPEWWGNLAWPAFGPDTKWEENKIPAQVRYEGMKK